jgi:hypothetical protein
MIVLLSSLKLRCSCGGYPAICHRILAEVVPVVGLPVLSRAGLNFARLVKIRQVVESSVRDPLDEVTLQPETRPLVPT